MKSIDAPQSLTLATAGWPAALTSIGLLLIFTIPAPLLDSIGFAYSSSSGGALEKIHPGSDLIALAFAGAVVRTGHPILALRSAFDRFPGAAAFLGVNVFLALYIIKVQHAPFTLLIDTFVAPVLLFGVLVDLAPRWLARIETGLHGFAAVNAALGVIEFMSGWRALPSATIVTDPTIVADWRASALLGHPLASAAMAGLYAIVLALGGGRRLPAAWRLPAILLQLVGLAAFGGRTALVCTLLCLAVVVTAHLAGFLAGRSIDRRIVGRALLSAPPVAALAAGVVGSGFLDQLVRRFTDDNGSAEARTIILNLFGYLSWPDILFGPDLDRMISLQHLEGIEVGVESFWFGFVLNYGLFAAGIFFAGLACFFIHVMARMPGLGWVPLLYFVVIISTSISLSAKSTALTQFLAVSMAMMPVRSDVVWRPVAQRTQAVKPS